MKTSYAALALATTSDIITTLIGLHTSGLKELSPITNALHPALWITLRLCIVCYTIAIIHYGHKYLDRHPDHANTPLRRLLNLTIPALTTALTALTISNMLHILFSA